MEYDIHVECAVCEGRGEIETQRGGVNANGPWVDITDDKCRECEGGGFIYVGREHYDSVADLRADYPESLAKHVYNLDAGEWI
jgi:hypothetical protein